MVDTTARGLRTTARLLTGIAVVAAITLAASPGWSREFRAADTQPPDYPTVQALLQLGDLIASRTKGQHSLKVFHSRQLGEEKETIEQTRVGAIDLNRTNVAPLSQIIPEAGLLALPFLFRSVEHLHKVIDGPIGAEILASFDAKGLIGLCFYDSGARSFYSRKPIESIADLKGLRIRVQQSEQMIAMVTALGALAVPLPYGQVNTALTTGIIDGAENNWPSYYETGHYRAAPNYTLTEHTMGPEVLVMSKKAWDALSPEEQGIFRSAARDSASFMRGRWEERERKAEEALRAAGTMIHSIDKQPFIEALQPVYQRFVVDPRLQDLVHRIQAVP